MHGMVARGDMDRVHDRAVRRQIILRKEVNTLAKKPDIHVVPNPGSGWDVKREGGGRVSSHHETQRDAIDRGRGSAKQDKVELVIHGRDGRIRDSDSYGPDPLPPRDKKH